MFLVEEPSMADLLDQLLRDCSQRLRFKPYRTKARATWSGAFPASCVHGKSLACALSSFAIRTVQTVGR